MEKSRRWKQNRHRIKREKDRLRKKTRRNVYAMSKAREAPLLKKLAEMLKAGTYNPFRKIFVKPEKKK